MEIFAANVLTFVAHPAFLFNENAKLIRQLCLIVRQECIRKLILFIM